MNISKEKRKFFLLMKIFLLIAFFLPLLSACSGSKKNGGNSNGAHSRRGNVEISGAVVVQATTILQGQLVVNGDYPGDIHTDQQASLSSQVPGRIRDVKVELGDTVKKGDILATVDKVETAARVTQLSAIIDVGQGSVAEAENTVKNLERQLERKKPLLAKSLISQQEIDNLEAQVTNAKQRVDIAKANLRSSSAQLQSARNALSNTEIRSPIDGEIALRTTYIGNYVTPAQTLFRVVNPDKIYVSVRVPETESGLVQSGASATVRVDATGGKAYQGVVRRIAPALDAATRTLQVDIAPPDGSHWEGLKPGMFARVQIALASRKDAIFVDRQALRKTPDGAPYLWRVNSDNTVTRVFPKTGISTRTDTEILDGLKPGDVVLLRGQEKIREDGTSVSLLDKPSNQKPAADVTLDGANGGSKTEPAKKEAK